MLLIVWLFALIASWAHACILQPWGTAAGSREHHEHIGLVARHDSSHEGAAEARGTHEPDAAQKACASFCETEWNIVAKAQPVKRDGVADPFALVAQANTCWPAFSPGRAEIRWRPPSAPPPPGPPVAIAFPRLTI